MKTLLTSFLAIIFLVPSFANQAISTPPTDEGQVKIKVTVDIGRKSRDCHGFGVCSVTIEVELLTKPAGENTATGTAWIENGKLSIAFDRATMTDATYANNFGSGQFLLEEGYSLSPEVAKALGVNTYDMKPGSYTVLPARDATDAILVNF